MITGDISTGDSADMSRSTSTCIKMTVIAAVTRTNGLGTKGTLPWKLSKEMAHFRKATTKVGKEEQEEKEEKKEREKRNAVIMGRKTWESIPEKFRPLKGRINIVISQSVKEKERLGIDKAEDTHLCASLEDAIGTLQGRSWSSSTTTTSSSYFPTLARTFLIGGAQLYSQALEKYSAPSSASSKGYNGNDSKPKAIVDRLLITRIASPAFEECDVFLPEFRSRNQIQKETTEDGLTGEMKGEEGETWKRRSQEGLDDFLGLESTSEEAVPKGIREEKGVRYILQMWERSTS